MGAFEIHQQQSNATVVSDVAHGQDHGISIVAGDTRVNGSITRTNPPVPPLWETVECPDASTLLRKKNDRDSMNVLASPLIWGVTMTASRTSAMARASCTAVTLAHGHVSYSILWEESRADAPHVSYGSIRATAADRPVAGLLDRTTPTGGSRDWWNKPVRCPHR